MKLLAPTCKMAGRYKIEAFVPGNPKRVLADWFPNVITDYGLNRLWTESNNQFARCFLGTGNTLPATSDTSLVGYKAMSEGQTGYSTRKNGYFAMTFVYQFGQGSATGVLAEVGIGSDYYSPGQKLFSRALIKDAQGNPTTITVLPDEIVQVSWEFRYYWPVVTTSGSVEIQGSGTHAFECAPKNTGYEWWHPSSQSFGLGISSVGLGTNWNGLAPTEGAAQPVQDSSSQAVYLPYVAGSFTGHRRDMFSIDKANYPNGINGITFGTATHGWCPYQIYIDPPIMKTADQQLTLDLSLSWARA